MVIISSHGRDNLLTICTNLGDFQATGRMQADGFHVQCDSIRDPDGKPLSSETLQELIRAERIYEERIKSELPFTFE